MMAIIISIMMMMMMIDAEEIRFRKPATRLLQRQQRQGQLLQIPRSRIIKPPQLSSSWSNLNNRINSNVHRSSSSWNTGGKQQSERQIAWTSWSQPSSTTGYNVPINVIDTGNTRHESWNQPATYDNSPPGAYHWGYRWIDEFGNQMFREETADGYGTVTGRYSFREYNGLMRIVEYIADQNGYRTRIRSNEPGIVTSYPAGAEIIRFENENDIPAK
ncbi:hypothetical protein DERF_014478 [Dermatophagoides farinae]|uniref:Uncharacterized protein n=2 Tax=Dermatophagoides farinae TaxID=6954 RepID=A0A922HM44_DERFA|nr:hypothetical protein DERF_014478 [Dermatophagoides farinae]